jgi:hypothetical protein
LAIAVDGAALGDGTDLLEDRLVREPPIETRGPGRARRSTPSGAPSARSGRWPPPAAASPFGPFAQTRTFSYDFLRGLQDLDLYLLLAE